MMREDHDPFSTPVSHPMTPYSDGPSTPPFQTPALYGPPLSQQQQQYPPLQPPFVSLAPSYGSSRDSQDDPARHHASPSPLASGMVGLLPAGAPAMGGGGYGGKPGTYHPGVRSRAAARKKHRLIGAGAVAVLAVIVLVVVIPVYFAVIKKHQDAKHSSGSGSGGGGDSGGSSGSSPGKGNVAVTVTGGDGSTVVMDDGSTFVYSNSFGGVWMADPTGANPFLSGAKPNAWTPAINETWTWGKDKIYGVNLGGWFILEPFITPALFQAYPAASDEWTLSALWRAAVGDQAFSAAMEDHYANFITEADFAQIAGAGLNWVRIPIPFWAIGVWSDIGTDGTHQVAEPFLETVCWKYIVRALGWARKYGIRVNLDLHTAPGSQNGYNHSGKGGQVNFLNGPMGVANAERMLDYIRIIVEFISQPEWADLIPMFGIVNEALLSTIGKSQITSFYLQAHNMIRGITGIGEGHGPYISIHDGFIGVSNWGGFLPGSDRIIMDTHPYFAFDQQPNDSPIATSDQVGVLAGGIWPKQACSAWGPGINTSHVEFGVTVAGEFSNGYNDCGLFLTGVNNTAHYGGDCALWEDSQNWNASVKAGLHEYALASMDAMQNWFFWTWKIGNATDGVVRAPLWSYQLGLEGGWMPTDPRTSIGTCASLNVVGPVFNGTYSAWQTGGLGAGTIDPTAIASFGQWPPATISHVAAPVTLLPTYTATATVRSLTFVTPTPTSTATGTGAVTRVAPTVSIGSGWFNSAGSSAGVTAVAGCVYYDAWSALNSPAPTAVCTGA
ncbi:unnamed protein product [Mycena citricolor]|uniref:glucan 1,3-beta-glucosidase n=1 Tax=Mycena citricolor TaxID=2018698 RepID=A0AAD2JYK7_9AGAR|nr:unnamed protein product [Mycena citricolor]